MHRSRLPVLRPCDQDWATMSGTDTRRRCDACEREVLHLSAMPAEAAIDALIARGGQACVRYRVDAAGEIEFAPPLPHRPGPIAAAALALTACAGWAEDPATVTPGQLGMCIPDADDPDACDDLDAPPPAQEPPEPIPEPTPEPTGRDVTAIVDVEATTGDSSVPRADLRRTQEAAAAPVEPQFTQTRTSTFVVGMLRWDEYDLSRSLFDRKSRAGPGLDWYATVELLRMRRELRREARQRRRAARRR